MKIIAVLFAAVLLVAGCSGSDSEPPAKPAPTPSATDESKGFDRGTLDDQAEAQAEQREKALKQLEKSVDERAKGVVVDIGIYSGREPTPRGGRVNAKIGENITLSVTSTVDEELHVHSDPEHTFQVKPGKDQLFSFTIDTPGQVAVEAHHSGVTIVQLVVRP